jgi:hypothetical protein
VKVVVVGGHSRNIGKTSVAASIIAATPELAWTALKITQYGHHICSASGHECGCVVEDPDHPFAITRENESRSGTDTARLLQAGAREVYWVRTRSGDLEQAMPSLRELLDGREHVLFESNSVLRFVQPDVYLSVLQYDVDDFKLSSRLYLNRADAFVIPVSEQNGPRWPGIDADVVQKKPLFAVRPPSFVSEELLSFVRNKLKVPAASAL